MDVHSLHIPDELLKWAGQPEQAVLFAQPWASYVRDLIADAEVEPLPSWKTDRLLGCLDALVSEAMAAGRTELLLGFDLFTAEWLKLSFSWEDSDGRRWEIGPGGQWSYQEVRVLVDCPTGVEAVGFCAQVKDLVADVFPAARIGAIVDSRVDEPLSCTGCGTRDATTMVSLETGSEYCSGCWSALLAEPPSKEELKARKRKGGR